MEVTTRRLAEDVLRVAVLAAARVLIVRQSNAIVVVCIVAVHRLIATGDAVLFAEALSLVIIGAALLILLILAAEYFGAGTSVDTAANLLLEVLETLLQLMILLDFFALFVVQRDRRRVLLFFLGAPIAVETLVRLKRALLALCVRLVWHHRRRLELGLRINTLLAH